MLFVELILQKMVTNMQKFFKRVFTKTKFHVIMVTTIETKGAVFMFSRDDINKTITMQDDSATSLYNLDDFVKRMNQVIFLMNDEAQGSPAGLYANSQFETSEKYNEFAQSMANMSKQLSFLVGKLKKEHLPVTLPDAAYFARSFKKMMDGKLSGKELDEAIKKDADAFKKAVDVSVQQNINTATKNKIPLDKPRETTK